MTLAPELDSLHLAAPGSQDAKWRRLFNRASFHALTISVDPHGPREQHVLFTDVHDDAGRVLGGLSGVRDGDTFVSGYGAPFGGFDIVADDESVANILRVVGESIRRIEATGVSSIRLTLPPVAYSANEAMVQCVLFDLGFAVQRSELNRHLQVSDWRTPLAYVHDLPAPAQQSLRYLVGQDLRFGEVTHDGDIARAQALLAGGPVSDFPASAEYLAQARTRLSPHARLFTISRPGGLDPVAAALMCRVAPGRDYLVGWGVAEAAAHGLAESALPLLAYRLVESAIASGTGLLDLGATGLPAELVTSQPRFTVSRPAIANV